MNLFEKNQKLKPLSFVKSCLNKFKFTGEWKHSILQVGGENVGKLSNKKTLTFDS